MIETVKKQLVKFDNMMQGTYHSLPDGCNREKQLFLETAMLTPSDRIMQLHDPNLAVFQKQDSKGLKEHTDELQKHVKEHWEVNTTFVDLNWFNSLLDRTQYNFSHDPFKTRASFEDKTLPSQPQEPTRLFDYFAPFFQDVAKAMKHLEGRVRIEAVLNDYVDFAEKLRFGLYRETDGLSAAAFERPKDFPNMYDRIHLSNIP